MCKNKEITYRSILRDEWYGDGGSGDDNGGKCVFTMRMRAHNFSISSLFPLLYSFTYFRFLFKSDENHRK